MKLKLSELSNEIEIAAVDSNTIYTVAELKQEITEFNQSHHETPNWHTVERKRWEPDASYMLESYIENESDEMYEDWDECAKECITEDVVSKIQAIFDEAFKGDSATEYWDYDKPVEIDIFPNNII